MASVRAVIGGFLAVALSGLLAGGAVYAAAVARWEPSWEVTSRMEETDGDYRQRTETLKLTHSQPTGWVVVERQDSVDGDTMSRMETLKRTPPPVAERLAFAAAAAVAIAVLGALFLLSLSTGGAFLGCGAFALALFGVLGLFAAVATGAAVTSHTLLGPLLGRWAALLTTPVSFWGSVNFLGLVTQIVRLCVAFWSKVRLVYGGMLSATHVAADLTRDVSYMQKVFGPGLLRPFLHGPHGKPATTQEWAAQLDEALSRHLGAERGAPTDAGRFALLAAEIGGPEPPRMPPFTGLASILPCIRAYLGGFAKAVRGTRRAIREGDDSTRLTARDLVAFVWHYLTSLLSACLEHSRLQLWAQAHGRCFKHLEAADCVQWRLVADQYDWSSAQKLSVSDVAARMLERHGKEGATARALRAWLALDVALSWCIVVPALWVPPPRLRDALLQRREVVVHLASLPRDVA